ncbi:succinate-semialdehyde dehydrogenase/glutarate-semialdehyde dehydrogenase [Amycolatopsis bartoniae]|uniref:NAD-dependent succinate-semialdehyde dehydrogenase n=1 Tax=Amycolatopsis bartoniae TaxID=941986 RepID=A0A8H9MBD2_9PSEU|nr:NAD-dependent succinate-semialdehyde dehydrogenase [Amycolatopsis bartoniae]MBB2936064.1 succinate-semialdehyde dehydrogenase/glutarate-semialdehyde dehydrogenase [Amycolatopsis bartoniae]TVT03551.1 NAD-dependent succinate-semialdehyde dehydrogenase [Amycolatopsis bartoniae]GHF63867.1 NAD-dependent succinate-semialdehyde dehydrogenase [Amycolatopsis bartoniae]
MKFIVDNPATGQPIATVVDNGPAEATAAVDAASAAARGWARTPARTRSEVLHRTFELMLRDREELAALIVSENGKSLADARGEVTYAAEFFRWYGEEAVRTDGSYGPSPAGGTRTLVTRKPVGVAALVTPWNFPAAMATRKIGPALAAGCTVVLKPAAETPLTALAIARLLTEAGLPDGVVNVVTTTDAAAVVTTWLEDPRVRKISFTGSTRVGQLLLRQAADRVVNASMELGGNAPFVVTADADLDAAVEGAMIAKFRNGGQACTAANRFYVHADVAEEFTARLARRVEALEPGELGPLISAKAVEGVTKLVESALAAGARVVARAEIPGDGKGYFFPPTVLADVPADAEIVRQEIFGPVAPIVVWRAEEEMLELVNASELGLAAYVYAGELQHALRLGEAIDAGMVGINRGLVSDPAAPFGGMKQSGLGREGAREGLHEFTEIQYLSVDWPEV